jgi:spore coat polysaccharide biosynthesis predicted glycosyltransferase SpsG/RimJ/RimL family protein N-acetyltransferase
VFFSALRDKDALVVYVDDMAPAGLNVDVVINHAPGVNASDYRQAGANTLFYVGAEYSMVSFKRSSTPIGDEQRLGHMLIAMGGADPTDMTSRVVGMLSTGFREFSAIHVVAGHHYPFLERLNSLISQNPKVILHHGINRTKVYDLMEQCGVAVLSASTMAIEYAHASGLLCIVQTAENQRRVWTGLLSLGMAVPIEQVESVLQKRTDAYHAIQSKQSQNYDGKSPIRFRKMFSELFQRQNIVLRAATLDDTMITFKWASDPVVRDFSFNRDPISQKDHEIWFERKLSDSNCLYLIADVNGEPAGSIRFDVSHNSAVISYLVDPSMHGRGFGKLILLEGIRNLVSQFEVKEIVGRVVPENIPSVRIFEKIGFSLEEDDYTHRSLKFVKRLV